MDTGANRTTFTQKCISQHPELVTKTIPRGHHTRRFVYGNGTEFQSEDAVELGDYTAHIVPASHEINLISVNDICVKGGHVVLFTPTSVNIRDIGASYEVRYPKLISEDDWLVPPDVLNVLSDLRARHPLSIDLRNSLPTRTIGFESIQPLQQQPVPPSSPTRRRRSSQFSGRLHNSDPSLREKVFTWHLTFAHACEDAMVHGLEPQGPDNLPYWRNTGITPENVRAVFRHEPCLLCVLAKRRKEGKRRPPKLKSEQPKSAETSELRHLAEPTVTDPEESYKEQLIEDLL
jgi:hypothetical protein